SELLDRHGVAVRAGLVLRTGPRHRLDAHGSGPRGRRGAVAPGPGPGRGRLGERDQRGPAHRSVRVHQSRALGPPVQTAGRRMDLPGRGHPHRPHRDRAGREHVVGPHLEDRPGRPEPPGGAAMTDSTRTPVLPGPLVDAEWLRAHLGVTGLVVADSRWRPDGSARALYESGHIPGAVFVDVDTDLSTPRTAHTGRHPLPTP